MPQYLNKNLNAIPVYQVDANGVIIPTNPSGAASNQVQGNVASGAADVGNPIKTGGVANAFIPTAVPSGSRVNQWMSTSGALQIGGLAITGTDGQPNIGITLSDTNGSSATLANYNHVFNGATWDRQRGDINGTWMLTTGTTLGISDGAGNFITCPRTPIGTAIAQLTYGLMFNGTGWDRQRGDVTGSWVHAPQNTVSTALSGSLATAGATATVAFVNTARQEVINASTGTIWASWGTPAVNGSGSFPIAAGGSFSTDRTTGTLSLLSTAATQAYTVNRYA